MTQADEMEDFQNAIRDALDGAYLDWPNEAGVRHVQDRPFLAWPLGRLLVC